MLEALEGILRQSRGEGLEYDDYQRLRSHPSSTAVNNNTLSRYALRTLLEHADGSVRISQGDLKTTGSKRPL